MYMFKSLAVINTDRLSTNIFLKIQYNISPGICIIRLIVSAVLQDNNGEKRHGCTLLSYTHSSSAIFPSLKGGGGEPLYLSSIFK